MSKTYNCLTAGARRLKKGRLLFLLPIVILTTAFTERGGTEWHTFISENTINPTVLAFAIQPSCTDGVPQSDGYLQISSVANGDKLNYSVGSTYTGPIDYNDASALNIGTLPFQFNAGLSNPSGSQDYTIRVFNGASSCYTDVVVIMNEQDCTIGCNCNEYVYLNEPTSGSVHKFSVNPDSTFTEIGSPWYGGSELPSPHGLGTDLNGNVYIGEHFQTNNHIRKLNCYGEIFPEPEFAIQTTGQFNITTIGNTIYYNETGLGIKGFDICTGSLVGEVEVCESLGGFSNWGFSYNSTTELFHAVSGMFGNNPKGIWVFTADDFDTNPATCISHITLDVPIPSGDVRGIVSDNDGNIYIVVRNLGGCSFLIKYDENGIYQSQSISDCSEDGEGWRLAIGLIYSETTNLIYVSTESQIDDCVYAFSTSLDTLGTTVAPAPVGGNNSKGIAITKECCPVNNNITIDTTICVPTLGSQIFLQNLINCEGSVCEGSWIEDSGNTGLAFNSCDNVVTISGPLACGKFVLESDGSNPNASCSAFKITINICSDCFDWGDLPDISSNTASLDYQTDSINNGPAHLIIENLYLGNNVDKEGDGQATTNADGDTDDAFTFSSTNNFVPNGLTNIPINVFNATGTTAYLEAWIDWNNDGDFDDANEWVIDLSDNGAGDFGQTYISIPVPEDAVVDENIGFRVRLSHTDNMTPYGTINSGEVEDYLIQLECSDTCPQIGIQLSSGN